MAIKTFLKSLFKKEKKIVESMRKLLGLKPILSYLEFHLTDHCNLNCKGCGHFAPLSEELFADLSNYKNDLNILKNLFANVETIVLMGGEPLLHPQLDDFLYATRAYFPKSNIKIYTNGLLLPRMSNSFWNACRACYASIEITIYPPVKKNELALMNLVKKNGLKVLTHTITMFHAFFNKKGDNCVNMTFEKCHERWYNPMLRDGKIYVCHKPATLKYFNDTFNLKIPTDGFVNIYDHPLDGWKIKEKLDIAPGACAFCMLGSTNIPVFPWAPSNKALNDWDASAILSKNNDS